MEEQEKTFLQKSLRSALVIGGYVSLVSILFTLMIYVFNPSIPVMGIVGVVSFIVTYVLIVILSIRVRKREMDNLMKYKDAVVFTLIVGLSASLITLIFSLLYQYVIDPSYMDNMVSRMLEFMESTGVPQKQVDAAIAEMLKSKELGTFLISQLKSILIFNLLVILFAPLFVKKNAPVF